MNSYDQTIMRLLLAILLAIVTTICYGKPLTPVPLSELATLSPSQSILAGNQIGDQSVMLILSPDTSNECSGTIKSCPNVRLYVSIVSDDKSKKPRLYRLPYVKRWTFGNWIIFNPAGNSEFVPFEFIIQTTLPDANVDAKEQEQFKHQRLLWVRITTVGKMELNGQ